MEAPSEGSWWAPCSVNHCNHSQFFHQSTHCGFCHLQNPAIASAPSQSSQQSSQSSQQAPPTPASQPTLSASQSRGHISFGASLPYGKRAEKFRQSNFQKHTVPVGRDAATGVHSEFGRRNTSAPPPPSSAAPTPPPAPATKSFLLHVSIQKQELKITAKGQRLEWHYGEPAAFPNSDYSLITTNLDYVDNESDNLLEMILSSSRSLYIRTLYGNDGRASYSSEPNALDIALITGFHKETNEPIRIVRPPAMDWRLHKDSQSLAMDLAGCQRIGKKDNEQYNVKIVILTYANKTTAKHWLADDSTSDSLYARHEQERYEEAKELVYPDPYGEFSYEPLFGASAPASPARAAPLTAQSPTQDSAQGTQDNPFDFASLEEDNTAEKRPPRESWTQEAADQPLLKRLKEQSITAKDETQTIPPVPEAQQAASAASTTAASAPRVEHRPQLMEPRVPATDRQTRSSRK